MISYKNEQALSKKEKTMKYKAPRLPQEIQADAGIGQHFLTNRAILRKLVDSVPTGVRCIEIGAGLGTITSQLLDNGNTVASYEVDSQFKPVLENLEQQSSLEVRWKSFLDADVDELNKEAPFNLVGNIPYHISEPLMFMLTRLNFESATLLVGKRLANSLQATPDSRYWGRMSLLAHAYFNVEVLSDVPREDFDPEPRKDGALLFLTKKTSQEIGLNEAMLQSIVQAGSTNTTVARALKAVEFNPISGKVLARKGEVHKKSYNRSRRRMTRIALKEQAMLYSRDPDLVQTPPEVSYSNMLDLVEKSGISAKILSKPLSGINNQELRTLCIAISSIASKDSARRHG